ncbi:MAG: YceI family protein [Bacteroidota bacterium]
MKKISIIAIACIAIIASGFTASILWDVSNEGVTVNFELPDEGTKGTLSGLKASIDFNQKDLSASKISASVDVATLNTGNGQKDKHLLSADFFNVEKYPTMSFISTSIKATSEGFMAAGNLTIKDSTKSVEIPFSFTEDASGSGFFKGTLSIFSSDYGVMKKSKTGKDKVVVVLTVPVKK